METLEIEINDGIGALVLNRPAKLNAMNATFFTELPRAIEILEADTAVRVIVIRANGPHFSAGLDLTDFAPGSQNIQSTNDIRSLQLGFIALATAQKPTLAVVNGYCIGGGLDLIAACDLRLATRSAIFSLREVRIGIVADLGSLTLLSGVLPQAILAEMVRVTAPGGLVVINVSDHIRRGEPQPVSQWWLDMMKAASLEIERQIKVPTPRMRYGQNHQLRVENEWVYVGKRNLGVR